MAFIVQVRTDPFPGEYVEKSIGSRFEGIVNRHPDRKAVKAGIGMDYSDISNYYDTSLRSASRSLLTLIKALLYFWSASGSLS